MILDEIVEYKKLQLEEEKRIITVKELLKQCEDKTSRDFKSSLTGEKMAIIAEIKKASPSKGVIRANFDHRKIAHIYNEIPINAISVLTEKKYFQGNDAFIKDVKEITLKPVLRKDFIVDEFQVYQAKAIGADAVLLIAAVLGNKLKHFYDLSKSLGLHCLTEVHDSEEMKLAGDAGCDIIGVNNRDLRTFKEDIRTTERLLPYLPKGTIIVSESSIKTAEDIKYLRSLKVDAVLIGETFMRNLDDVEGMKTFIRKARD